MIDFKECFYYDETSPSGIRWKIDKYKGRNYCTHYVFKNEKAGYYHNGYWRVGHLGKHYLVHRIVWELCNDKIPEGIDIDHIDGDRGNNVISNLRCVERSVNVKNKLKYKNNTSGVTGVRLWFQSDNNKFWLAACNNTDGSRNNKYFSINKYGYDEAFRLACEWRNKMILELNAQGAGYTERHGK